MKKIISVILVAVLSVALFVGCSKESKNKVTLREDLLEYGGDFWTKENKDTAIEFVEDIQEAYRDYQKNNDLEEYATTVNDLLYENMGFILDVSNSIDMSESNEAALLNVDILNINARNSDIFVILELGGTDEELEEKVHDAVNAVTYAFCNKEIAK